MSFSNRLRQYVKAQKSPLARLFYRVARGSRTAAIPLVPALHRPLYTLHRSVTGAIHGAARALWYTPLFQSRLEAPALDLFLYGGMPLVTGPVRITIGRNCRVSAHTTISGRTAGIVERQLIVGDNVDIGWQTTIAVGRTIRIGSNVRIAGRAFLAGYPGHPLDAAARARGEPDQDEQVGDIILEDDVWLATGVTVSAGVTIGRGTIVAAGSVVTRDLPPFVMAAGVPAKPVRSLDPGPGANSLAEAA